MRYISFDTAKSIAEDKAAKTGWEFSIMQKYNVHTHDYEYEVIPFRFNDAILVISPKS